MDVIESARPTPGSLDVSPEDVFPWEVGDEVADDDWAPAAQMEDTSKGTNKESMRLRLRNAPDSIRRMQQALSPYDALFNGFLDAPLEALQAAEEKLVQARQSRDSQAEAAALLMVADALISTEEPSRAVEKAEDALIILRELGDSEGEAAMVHLLAKAYLVQGDVKKALHKAEEALELFTNLDHAVGEGATVTLIAQLQLNTDTAAAGKLANESVELFRTLGDKRREAISQRTLLGVQLARGSVTEAIQTGKMVLATCREIRDRRGEASALILLAQSYLAKDDIDEALLLTKEALLLFRDFGDRKNEAASLDLIAGVQLAKKQTNEALRTATDAQRIFAELGDGKRAALMAPKIVSGRLALQELEEAYFAAQDMHEFFEGASDRKHLASSLHELAKVHLARGEAQEAREKANEARAIFGEINAWQGDVAVLQTLFQANFLNGSIDDGMDVAWEILAIYRKEGKRHQEGILLKDVATIELQMRLPGKVLRHGEAAIKILEECGDNAGAAAARKVVEKATWMKDVLKETVRNAEPMMARYRDTGNTEGLYEMALETYKTRLALAQYVK